MASITTKGNTMLIFLPRAFRPVLTFTSLKLETSSSLVKWCWRNNPTQRDVFRTREINSFKKPLQCEEVFFMRNFAFILTYHCYETIPVHFRRSHRLFRETGLFTNGRSCRT